MTIRKLLFLIVLVLCSPNFSRAEENRETNYYRGTIGRYSVTMKLAINASNIDGEYIYDNKGIKIDIKGKKVEHTIEMGEFYEGQKTGTFTGRYDSQSMKIEGDWRKSSYAPALPFMLDVVEIRPNYLPKVNVGNPADNQALQLFLIKSMLEEYSAEAHEANEISYDVILHTESLISILFTYRSYGGAHPNTAYESLNISVRNGRANKIQLEGLFKKNADYVNKLSKLCIADLKKQDADLYEKELSKPELDVFNITSDGIRFSFAPYVVGPYAAGSYFVSIPYKSMKNLIAPDGPLRFLKDK